MELLRRGGAHVAQRVARLMRDNGWEAPPVVARDALGRRGAPRAAGQRGAGPGGARLQRIGPRRGVVRRHHLRAHPPRAALPGARDGHIWPGRIVGWSMSDRMGAALADDALRMAIARRRPPAGCTRHSGHGSRYVSLRLGRTMRDNGIRPSMGGDLLALGQRGHGVADGPRQGGVRARAHLREPRAGGAGDIRVHRVPLQPGADALRARPPQPRGVRRRGTGKAPRKRLSEASMESG